MNLAAVFDFVNIFFIVGVWAAVLTFAFFLTAVALKLTAH